MADFSDKYQRWLNELAAMLKQTREEQVSQLVQWSETIRAYLKAGKDLSAYETQLFLETLKRQSDADLQPSIWPEALWYELSLITDKTQVEWQELLEDLHHHGVYLQGERVGMGLYRCNACGQTQSFFHPDELSCCADCGGQQFSRLGLPS